MEIQVTDKKLLSYSGGIVLGMSGSPIIQDGKLVGAVTHVMVNDPTRGYGIFIEEMLGNNYETADITGLAKAFVLSALFIDKPRSKIPGFPFAQKSV